MQKTTYKFIIAFIILLLPILACGAGKSHLEKAREALAEGDTVTALEEYTQTIDGEDTKSEEKFTALTERADLHYSQQDVSAALADYDAALALTDEDGSPAGDHAIIYTKRTEIYVAQENWEGIVADLDQVLAAQPNNYEALARRGYAHLQLRNFEQAIADLKASLQGEVVAASADVDSKQNLVRAYYDLAQAMLDLGEYEESVHYYTEALSVAEDTDDKVEILVARGFAYSELPDHEKALADLDQAIALNPNEALAYAYRSYVYSDQERYEAAIADATKAVELGEGLSDVRRSSIMHARALAYLYTDQYEQAILDATESIRLEGEDSPQAARTYNIRARAHRLLGNYDQAIIDASRAIELGTTDIVALSGFYRNRALAHYFNDDIPSALVDIEAAISLDAENPNPDNFDLAARMLYDAGQYEAAIENYRQALTLAPDDPWLHNDLGDAYYQLDDMGSAETEYRAAIRLESDIALFHENLGLVLRLTERYDEAVESYTQALTLDDHRPYSWLGRGLAYYNLFQDKEAISDLETALIFDLSPDTVDFINEILAKLK